MPVAAHAEPQRAKYSAEIVPCTDLLRHSHLGPRTSLSAEQGAGAGDAGLADGITESWQHGNLSAWLRCRRSSPLRPAERQ